MLDRTLNRRHVSLAVLAAGITAACNGTTASGTNSKETTMSQDTTTDWANLSASDWQARLTDMEYHVLREEGTERPFTSPLNNEKREGTFHCKGCDLPLFTHDMKYDSGTGWPSFFNVIEGSIGTSVDKKLFRTRTEYHCIRCGGHQGHVFNDGPRPTGLRYCNNGVAISFKPA